MPTYAANTSVAPEKSRAEIERTLARYGAAAFSYGYDADRTVIMFAAHGRKVRFEIKTPSVDEFRFTPTGLHRNTDAAHLAQGKAVRQLWRALALVIKAKLEAVESGLVTFEEEFLAHVLLPDGSTVGEWAQPQLEDVYATGEMPAVLPGSRPQLTETT